MAYVSKIIFEIYKYRDRKEVNKHDFKTMAGYYSNIKNHIFIDWTKELHYTMTQNNLPKLYRNHALCNRNMLIRSEYSGRVID